MYEEVSDGEVLDGGVPIEEEFASEGPEQDGTTDGESKTSSADKDHRSG